MNKLHLVTGYKGEEHIQSADQGSFNASFFGTGEFVMEAGNQFEASIMDNNTVRILDGDVLMKGRHLRIEPNTYADVTITTGTAGVNRNDLIVFEYKKNAATGVETSEIVVIKGTEASGNATDPEYVNGDILGGAIHNQMPMYRVRIEGVVLSAVEPMFTTIPSYKALAEKYAKEFQQACETHLDSLNILDTMEEVEANTQENQLAGALALKELSLNVSDAVKKISDTEATTEELNALVGVKGNIQKQFDDLEGFAHGTSIHVDNAEEAPAIVIPYGNTIQDGEPTTDVPIEVKSVVLREIKTCGKNLANPSTIKKQHDYSLSTFSVSENKITLSTGENGGANGFYFSDALKKGVKCFISGIVSTNITNVRIYRESDFNNWVQDIDFDTTGAFSIEYTPIHDNEIVRFWVGASTTCTLTDFMISEEGGKYEPYTESVATLSEPITLNGIGGVQDTLESKKFKTVVFDGSENWNSSSTTGRYYINGLGCKGNGYVFCSQAANNRTEEINTCYAHEASSGRFLIFTNFATLDEWKAHLASKPMTVVYELAAPIETPLPDADVEALRALQSFEGVTNVFNDANAEMDFIYATTKHSAITMENNKELYKCLQIVSFDAETGTLITKSVDYTE